MEQRRISFTYHINQVGECYLTEGDDIFAMFILLRRYGMEQIEAQFDINDGPGIIKQESNDNNTLVQPIIATRSSNDSTNDGRIENMNPLNISSGGKTMLSAAWSKLIDYEGQVRSVVRTNSGNRWLIHLYSGVQI